MTLARAFPLIAAVLAASLAPPARAGGRAEDKAKESAGPIRAVVSGEGTIVYERPDLLANALRLLYVGEVIEVLDKVVDQSGAKWARIRMGETDGFVKASAIQGIEGARYGSWQPPVVLRDQRPLSFSLRGGSEMFGAGMNIRYMPFTRLGGAFSVGSIMDYPRMKGTSLGTGLVSYLAMGNFSPVIETGFTRLSYHQDFATLRVYSFYLSVGLEYLFQNGFFANVMVTYLRSADVEVAFDYLNAKNGLTTVPPDFGVLDPGKDNTFQFVLPGVSIGYAF